MSRFDKLIQKVAKELHDGKLKPEDLNQEVISETYKQLEEAAGDGYGKNWSKPKGNDTLPNELRKNIYMFSGAKTYAQLQELNKLLLDQDGKIRPFNEFSQLVKKVSDQYNKNYLQAEYQTARTSAQMAEKWERLQETKDLFPNLKYRTAGDSRVRKDHAKLDGIIKPIDDAFWNRFYPPLDWRCRCDVVATAEDATSEDEKDLPIPGLKGNVGKDKEIFTKKGTFFKLVNTDEAAKRNLELTKLNTPYREAYKIKSGKKVEVSIFADQKDFEGNINTAIVIVDNLKTNVQIRPHLDTNIAVGLKNAEYYINGNISDLKSNFKENNYAGINRAFDAAKEQKLTSIVFDFTNSFKDLDLAQVNRYVLSNMNEKRGKQYNEIIFVYKNKAVRVSRDTIIKKQLIKELEKLKANS